MGTAEVLVVGTGYAGIELATTVAERLGSKGQVRMVTAGDCCCPVPALAEMHTVMLLSVLQPWLLLPGDTEPQQALPRKVGADKYCAAGHSVVGQVELYRLQGMFMLCLRLPWEGRTTSKACKLPRHFPAGVLLSSCSSELVLAHAGKEILEGCPPGQQEAARKMLQEQSVPVVTEALVTRVGLTEDQPASTSHSSRKTVALKTPTTDSQAYPLFPPCPQFCRDRSAG